MAAKVNRRRVETGTADFRHGDASQLPRGDNKFSAAAVMGAFEVFPEPMGSVKDLHRVLRPGGRLVVTLGMHADDGKDHTRDIEMGVKCYTANEIQSMFQEAGFGNVSVTLSTSKYAKEHSDIMSICGVK